MLNRSGESRSPCLGLNFKEKIYRIRYDASYSFFIGGLYQIEEVAFYF